VLTVTLNGKPKNFDTLVDGATLDTLITDLALKGDRVAAELNGEIIPRADWPATPVPTNSKLEIVHFVGGGCKQPIEA